MSITAIILAGGFGTRLQEVVSDRPKPLALINDRPFITYKLDQLINFGLNKVIISTGYMSEKFTEILGHEYNGLEIVYSREDEPLGTGGALRKAMTLSSSDTLVVMNGDSYIYCTSGKSNDSGLTRLLNQHSKYDYGASILLTKVKDTSSYGTVVVNENKQITNFLEKADKTTSNFINAGVYVFNYDFIKSEMPLSIPCSLERECFTLWSAYGVLGGFYQRSKFIDIGTPEQYNRAKRFFKGIQ